LVLVCAASLETTAADPTVTARAAVLLNADTGQILYAKNPHFRLPPASTTKVLTTLITLERLDLNTSVVVSENAALAPPSKLGLQPGEVVSARDLLYGIMLKSGNDASTAMAEAIGGSVENFAAIMNTRARQFGARHTHFRNPHGLPDDEHYSTAYDLAVIFRQAMNNPRFAEITGTKTSSVAIRSAGLVKAKLVHVRNHNQLLGTYDGMLGGKTGYTRAAKRCFVGEAERGSTRLIVAVLGSEDIWYDTQKLLEHGFERSGERTLPIAYTVSADRTATPARAFSRAGTVKAVANSAPKAKSVSRAKASSQAKTAKAAAKRANGQAKVSPQAKADKVSAKKSPKSKPNFPRR
jgi:D-alanyl-D-alanine carboxypeptidase